MLQKILNGLIITLIVAIGLSVVAIFVLDGLAQSTIQSKGSEGLGVSLTLDSSHVGFFSKKSSIKGVKIANPVPYQSEETTNLLTAEESTIQFNVFQMFEKKVVIPSVEVTGVVLSLQQHKGGTSNIELVVNNISKDETPEPTHPEPPFTIETLTIRDITVIASGEFTVLGSQPIIAPIKDDIVLHNIGSSGDAEVSVEVITTAITQAIMKQVMDNPVEGISKVVLSAALKTVGNLFEGFLDVAGGIFDLVTGNNSDTDKH